MFRAQSGQPLTITTGTDRALSGIQASIQRVNQVGDNPYGDGSINNWFNASAFAQPALGTYGTSERNAYDGPGFKNIDLSLVRQFVMPNAPPARGARRGVQRAQLVHPWQSEHGPERGDLRSNHHGRIRSAGHAVRREVRVLISW